MKKNLKLAFAYLRLSNEDEQVGESASIVNQRSIVQAYCRNNGIALVREFVDDGWSGGNFNRPAFMEMLDELAQEKANIVITKDLSRLGRDMHEVSFYTEQFFPENGIRYIAISDNFDTEQENPLAPFQYAMNEMYLRDSSRKVKAVLQNKRENGQYCACPPYGYKKAECNQNLLVPDDETAPVVQRIFKQAVAGDSSRTIALALNNDGIIPPLKYRALYRDVFTPEGAARASDWWSGTTVKRILKNKVYLGHTILGRSRKVSVKSKKKVAVPEEEWVVTYNTHQGLISQETFDLAQHNLGKASKDYRQFDHVRKSIFGGVAVCALCGHAMCSCGTVYKGEREKYWYLACNHQRKDLAEPCSGVRIRYVDLLEVVRQELNALLMLTNEEAKKMVEEIICRLDSKESSEDRKAKIEKIQGRMTVIDRMVTKLYMDNAEGRISDERLNHTVAELERKATGLKAQLKELEAPSKAEELEDRFERFFTLCQKYSHIEELDREMLLAFIDKIEIGPKELPEGVEKATHRNQPYRQSIRIFYKFIGELSDEAIYDMPKASGEA